MGIIQKQAIKGTVYSYIGVIIGFLTTAIIFPKILSTEEIGLLKILVAFSVLFAQFGSLGFGNVINRLFPYFRDKKNGHKGFLSVAIVISLTGFIISIIILEALRPVIIRNNIQNSELFIDYFRFLIPLIFFTLFFNLFDQYIKALYDAVAGTILKELVQRLLILISIVFYAINIIDLKLFVILYIISLSLPAIIITYILISKGEFRFTLPGEIFSKEMWREINILSLYGIVSGLGSLAILQVDSIMVNKFLGLSMTGIYATTFFFAVIILIPSRPLRKISTTLLADAWKNDDLETIRVIYSKSGINQAVLSILIFIGLWVNIDNIFQIIPAEYEAGKWVIFIVGLANVIEMTFGMSGVVIQTSGSYRVNTYYTLIFLFVFVASNIIFIPLLGINGAALAVLLSTVLINFLRYIFLYRKYRLTSFDNKTLITVLIGIVSYFTGYLLPLASGYIIDILYRSFVTGIVFTGLILYFRVSEDINLWLRNLLHKKIF